MEQTLSPFSHGDLAGLWFAAKVARDALWVFRIAQKLQEVAEKARECKLRLCSKQRIVQIECCISEDFPRIWTKGEGSYWSASEMSVGEIEGQKA